jgi:hypothetical protein
MKKKYNFFSFSFFLTKHWEQSCLFLLLCSLSAFAIAADKLFPWLDNAFYASNGLADIARQQLHHHAAAVGTFQFHTLSSVSKKKNVSHYFWKVILICIVTAFIWLLFEFQISEKMVFQATLLDAGVAVLAFVALAQYSKIRDKAERGFSWLAASGAILLFAGMFEVAPALGSFIGSSIWNGLGSLFQIVGWIFALIGVVFIAYETVIEK